MNNGVLPQAAEKALITIAPVGDNIMLVIAALVSKGYLYLPPIAFELLLSDEMPHTVRNKNSVKDADGKESKVKPLVAGQRKGDVVTFAFAKPEVSEIKSKQDIDYTFSVLIDREQTSNIVEVFKMVSNSLPAVQTIVRGGKKLNDSAVSAGLDLFTEN